MSGLLYGLIVIFVNVLNAFVLFAWALACCCHLGFILLGLKTLGKDEFPKAEKWLLRAQGAISFVSGIALIYLIAKKIYVWALYLTIFMLLDAIIALIVWQGVSDPDNWFVKFIKRHNPLRRKEKKEATESRCVDDEIGVPDQSL